MIYSELFIKIIINVLFISLYLACFFFTYGSVLSKKVVQDQTAFLVNNVSNIVKLFGPSVNNHLSKFFNNLKLPDLSKEDEKVSALNKKTMMNAVLANVCLIIFVGGCVGGTYYYAKKNNVEFSMIRILVQNIIILLFIAFTEFTFFSYYVTKYVSLNPNETKLTVLHNLRNLLDTTMNNTKNTKNTH